MYRGHLHSLDFHYTISHGLTLIAVFRILYRSKSTFYDIFPCGRPIVWGIQDQFRSLICQIFCTNFDNNIYIYCSPHRCKCFREILYRVFVDPQICGNSCIDKKTGENTYSPFLFTFPRKCGKVKSSQFLWFYLTISTEYAPVSEVKEKMTNNNNDKS